MESAKVATSDGSSKKENAVGWQRNLGLHGTCLQSVKFFFIRQYVQLCLSKNPKYIFYTHKELAHAHI